MSAQEEYCTPPSSDIEPHQRLPPSPPASPERIPRSAVDRVLGRLRLAKAGRPVAHGADWHTVALTLGEFQDFEARVAADESLRGWYADRVRWDYDPRDSEYLLRMPTAVHERFIAHVEDAIAAQISSLADRLSRSHDGDTAAALRNIFKGRSTTLELHAPKLENSSQSSQSTCAEAVVRRSPDATFYHAEADALPALVLVLEVSYSQQKKDLPRLAESYIVDSQHQIRCVVGLDITYATRRAGAKKDNSASISVWRPAIEQDVEGDEVGICQCDTDAAVFRDASGQFREGQLQLTVADLLPAAVLAELPDSAAAHHITLNYTQLASYLADAESLSTPPKTRSAPLKFRKRKRTPPERLSDERETSYLEREESDLEKERLNDCEWKGSGWTADQGPETDLQVRRSKRSKSGRGVGDGS